MKNKEQEFLKLIEYTLIDGYINENERNTLIAKGIQMGMDADEVDVILNAKLHLLSQETAKKLNKCPKCGEILKYEGEGCTSCDYMPISKKNNKKDDSDNRTAYQAVKDLADTTGIIITGKELSKYGLLWRFIKTIATGGLYLIHYRKKNFALRGYFDFNYWFHLENSNNIYKSKKRIAYLYKNDPKILYILEERGNKADSYRRNRIVADLTRTISVIVILSGLSAYIYKIASEKKPHSSTSSNNISIAEPLDTIDLIHKAIREDKPNEAIKWYNLAYRDKPNIKTENEIQGARVDSLIKIKKMDDALEQANILSNDYILDNEDRRRNPRVDSLLQIKINYYINLKQLDKAKKYIAFLNDFELEQKLQKQLKTEVILQKAKIKKH